MIGLDTNVLVRYIVQDDEAQAHAATQLIEESCTPKSPGYVCQIVLCELVWVLRGGYDCGRQEVAAVLRRLFDAENLQIERLDLAWQALRHYEDSSADYADCLISVSNRAHQARVTYSFDRKATGDGLFEPVPERREK